jgi:hypothetical protein
MSALAVEIDGRALPEPEAREVWTRFSAWMDEHRGDLAGFARREGWASVRPDTRGGGAVLVVSTTAAPAGRPAPSGKKGGAPRGSAPPAKKSGAAGKPRRR